MPFSFSVICDLLQELEDQLSHKTTSKHLTVKNSIQNWFLRHRDSLDAADVDTSAVLSTLLPARRTDRVYNIQAKRLESIIGSALRLGESRVKELRRHHTPGLGVDLGDCVQAILTNTPNPPQNGVEISVEELDELLGGVAASCRFSSPLVRAAQGNSGEKSFNGAIGRVYERLTPRDAKWFTRLILKDYQPVILDEHLVLRSYHILLPELLKVRDDLAVITSFLAHIRRSGDDQRRIASTLKPKLGVKVGRQTWLKGRSIKNCVDMCRGRLVSCEEKVDGEYCQIHIDLSKGPRDCLQIFSKSGKDSTRDRVKLHSAILESLNIGKPNCPIKQGCILEGEMVLYSSKDEKVMPFHKIRKHVSRSGVYIGTDRDSQPHDYEHLMIVYFDVLLLDNESLLGHRQSERHQRLKELITFRTGYAELVKQQAIRFSRNSSAAQLRQAFADCIVQRGEGLVLKPDEPYFDFSGHCNQYSCFNIKLKKEYIQGWGDVGDFAVVGASYEPAKAKSYKIPNLKWTHFYIACLENRDQVKISRTKPRFIVVNVVELNETLMKTFCGFCSPPSVAYQDNQMFDLRLRGAGGGKPPTVVFLEPPVFDVRCFSFSKESNADFWSMRFPGVSKIHFDRYYMDAITFDELQEAAYTATETPEVEDSQEMRMWISRLEKADPRGRAVDAVSQRSSSAEITPSPESNESWRAGKSNLLEPIVEELQTTAFKDAHYDPDETQSADEASASILPLSPPTSSAMEQDQHMISSPGSSQSNASSQPKKRPKVFLDKEPAHKTRKLSKSHVSARRKPTTSFDEPASSQQEREPLSQIDGNRSFAEQRSQSRSFENPGLDGPSAEMKKKNTSKVDVSSSLSGSFVTAQEIISPSTSHESEATSVSPSKPPALGDKIHAPGHHELAFRLTDGYVMLAPCINNYPWITEDLLRRHGVTEFVTEPQAWQQSTKDVRRDSKVLRSTGSIQRTSAAASEVQGCKAQKYCFVESRRQRATRSFIKKIERLNLTRRNGKRDWVLIYDWRVLEAVPGYGKQGKRLENLDEESRRKFFVGIA